MNKIQKYIHVNLPLRIEIGSPGGMHIRYLGILTYLLPNLLPKVLPSTLKIYLMHLKSTYLSTQVPLSKWVGR